MTAASRNIRQIPRWPATDNAAHHGNMSSYRTGWRWFSAVALDWWLCRKVDGRNGEKTTVSWSCSRGQRSETEHSMFSTVWSFLSRSLQWPDSTASFKRQLKVTVFNSAVNHIMLNYPSICDSHCWTLCHNTNYTVLYYANGIKCQTYWSCASNCLASSSFCLFIRPRGNSCRLTPVFSNAFVIVVTSVCQSTKLYC